MGTHPIFESDFDCLTDQKPDRKKCLLHELMPSVSRSTAERRPPSPLLTARLARVSSRSTESPLTSSSPKLSSSNSRSQPSSSARNDLPVLTSASEWRVVVESPRCTPSDRPSPELLSLTTKSTSTSSPNKRSRISSSLTIDPSLSPILDERSPRSSAVQVPEPDTRNLTVKLSLCTCLPSSNKLRWKHRQEKTTCENFRLFVRTLTRNGPQQHRQWRCQVLSIEDVFSTSPA